MKTKLLARKGWTLAALVCFVLAAALRFALIGYSTLAYLVFGLGAVILWFLLSPRWCRVALGVLLAAGCLLFAAAEYPVLRAAKGEPEREADYLIVLGAGVHGTVPSLSLTDRLRAAQDYLERFPDCVAVLSGGQGDGEDITEAEAMAIWLTARGVSANRLIREDRATSTEENLRFSFALIPEGARVAVCSSEYHLCRAERMAEALGRSVFGVPGRTSLPVLRLNYFLREGFGMAYLHFFGLR